jgi:hypothetical protein
MPETIGEVDERCLQEQWDDYQRSAPSMIAHARSLLKRMIEASNEDDAFVVAVEESELAKQV